MEGYTHRIYVELTDQYIFEQTRKFCSVYSFTGGYLKKFNGVISPSNQIFKNHSHGPFSPKTNFYLFFERRCLFTSLDSQQDKFRQSDDFASRLVKPFWVFWLDLQHYSKTILNYSCGCGFAFAHVAIYYEYDHLDGQINRLTSCERGDSDEEKLLAGDPPAEVYLPPVHRATRAPLVVAFLRRCSRRSVEAHHHRRRRLQQQRFFQAAHLDQL